MTDTPPRPLHWVRDTESLDALLRRLRAAPVIALDTESNGYHRYFERVCLVQLSTPYSDYLIDPIECPSIDPLGSLLADPDVRIVMHGADYDVICLRRDYDFEIRGLFDTMIAARLLGRSAVSLQALLREYEGIEVDKAAQRADWTVRPLPEKLVEYARGDTAHLLPVAEKLAGELAAVGRLEAAHEEFRIVEGRESHGDRFPGDGWVRESIAKSLDDSQRGALRALWIWRDHRARKRDVPPFRILPTEVLVALARKRPSDVGALKRAGVRPEVARIIGKGILEVLRDAESTPLPQRKAVARRRPRPGERTRYDGLRRWRTRAAKARDLDPGVLISNAALRAIARVGPADPAELDTLDEVRRWQVKELGAEILEVLGQGAGEDPPDP